MNISNAAPSGPTAGFGGTQAAHGVGRGTDTVRSGAAPPDTSGPISASSTLTRDSLIAELPAVSSSVNSLQQAALQSAAFSGTSGTSADASLVSFPQLAPMPAPKKPPDVPTDDHGQSNIVFSDSDADGSLIH